MQDELRFAPASREAAGPYFPVGAAARLQNRATHDPTSTALNLAHSLCGFSQLAALQVRAPSRHGRTASRQHMHSRPELNIACGCMAGAICGQAMFLWLSVLASVVSICMCRHTLWIMCGC